MQAKAGDQQLSMLLVKQYKAVQQCTFSAGTPLGADVLPLVAFFSATGSAAASAAAGAAASALASHSPVVLFQDLPVMLDIGEWQHRQKKDKQLKIRLVSWYDSHQRGSIPLKTIERRCCTGAPY
jgi:hypothetical protein